MGLTAASSGANAIDNGLNIEKKDITDKIIALAGNPNVGKSSVFNSLTGMHQHTGNWPGKTVSNAHGYCSHNGINYIMVDIPGTYSLMAHSNEEEVARDFLCFGNSDAVIIVCDATCLERNLNLVLQTLEITENVVVCLNLMDEAKKKGIYIDIKKLSQKLNVPVVSTIARTGKGLNSLLEKTEKILYKKPFANNRVKYLSPIEDALNILCPIIEKRINTSLNPRWIALRLLENNISILNKISAQSGVDIMLDEEILSALGTARKILAENKISQEKISDIIASCIVLTAEDICNGTVIQKEGKYNTFDRKLDKIATSKLTGIPIMILLLGFVFWLTISAANVPSEYLSAFFSVLERHLLKFCMYIRLPEFIYNPLIFGVYHVLTWVISVMLPPMAIFFPIFTFLEDFGYLPRIAFNLDKYFKKCSACGKQALTM